MNGDSDVETESQTTDSSSSSSDCCDRDSEMMDELSPVLDTESPARRVKVFSCDESSTWVEIGIGQLYLGFLEVLCFVFCVLCFVFCVLCFVFCFVVLSFLRDEESFSFFLSFLFLIQESRRLGLIVSE